MTDPAPLPVERFSHVCIGVSDVERSLDFVHRAIATAPGLGSGHGPLNHWA